MIRRKPDDMVTAKEFERKCRALSERIAKRREKIKPTDAGLASAGTSADALRKANMIMFVRLGELAQVLETTPNGLLGFHEGEEREAVKGLLDAFAQSFGLPLEQAQPLADISR